MKKYFLFLLCISISILSAHAESFPMEGLQLWLKPENLPEIGKPVDQWLDTSPAERSVVVTKPYSIPTVTKDGPMDFPAVAFDGERDRLALPDLKLPYNTSVFIVSFDVEQKKGASVHRAILAADNSPYRKDGDGYGIGYTKDKFDGAMVILSNGTNWQHIRDLYTQTSRNAWEVMTFTKNGKDVALYRDGFLREARTFDRPDDAAYHTGYLLGGDVDSRAYRGAIAEVIAYDRALSISEVEAVHKYLSEKYGIQMGPLSRLTSDDPRFFHNGVKMFDNVYTDQPYIVKLSEKEWLAVVTTSAIRENSVERHMKALRSNDAGKAWKPISVFEPMEELREPSWGTLFVTPSGRIYCFYNLKRLPEEGRGILYVYRFSEDGGYTWSQRHTLPVRDTWHNEQFRSYSSWGIDPPEVVEGNVLIAFSKYGPNSLGRPGEGFFFKSDNLLTETDPEKINWIMLPEGAHGLASERVGTLQEEHNIEPLGGNDLYCTFRTIEGYVGEAYSHDGGITWTEPDFARYQDGRKIKNTRACAMVWRCENGKFLLWFHNNDGRQSKQRNKDRNPAWISGGNLIDGKIEWSQPEPALFTFIPAHNSGLSYPDLIEHDGNYFIAATGKQTARLNELDSAMLVDLWNQDMLNSIPQKDLLPSTQPFLPNVDDSGFTVTIVGPYSSERIVWSAKDDEGNGVWLKRETSGHISAQYKDSSMGEPHHWTTDNPVTNESVVTFIFDGAANWIYVVVDGKLQDGGKERQFGWGPIPYQMKEMSKEAVLPTSNIAQVILHDRRLTISETIGLHRALEN